jgi:PPOX class probable F420-dependent enzyme
MSAEEMESFLARPLVAVLTTLKPDGSPTASPVWYEFDGGIFYFWIGAGSAKARNIRSNARAAVCIASHEEPYQYVVAEGTCVIRETEVPARCYSISRRYYGVTRGAEFARKDLESGDAIVVALIPDHLITESSA